MTTRELPVATEMLGVHMRLKPGAIRELRRRGSRRPAFLLTDWITHTPPEVLAKNFGVSEAAFAKVPPNLEQQRYIFPGDVPHRCAQAVRSPQGTVPRSFKFRLADQEPIRRSKGQVRIVDSTLRWHPNADEWQLWVEGAGA